MKYKNIKKGIFLERPNRFIAYVNVDGEEKDEWSNHAIINGLSAAANERD